MRTMIGTFDARARLRSVGCVATLLALGSCTIIDRQAPADAEPSAGCGGVDHPSQGLERFTLEVDGDPRSYWLRVPDGYDPNFPFPLALMFHGAGGDGPSLYDYDGMVEQAALDAILVYPDALLAPTDLTAWIAQPGSRDIAFIKALLASVPADYCVDSSRIVLAGHSSGASMASEAACELGPSRLRAFAGFAGNPVLAEDCAGPVDAWLGHATNDPQVPYGQGTQLRDRWLEENGCQDSSSSTAQSGCVRYACSGAELEWCEPDTFEDVAHDWPSFAAERIWALLREG